MRSELNQSIPSYMESFDCIELWIVAKILKSFYRIWGLIGLENSLQGDQQIIHIHTLCFYTCLNSFNYKHYANEMLGYKFKKKYKF